MNIKEQLAETKKKQENIIAQINALEQQRQLLLQEALRIDGEIRLLKRMDGDKEK